ncbi:MAG TPA: hypothetical protein DEF00_03805 [Candidatus Taylorbacteria bacterium]|nr:hypothetical protein [Candidatus Taylorbacteria bacterium]
MVDFEAGISVLVESTMKHHSLKIYMLTLPEPRRGLEIPSTKHQIPHTLQIQNQKSQTEILRLNISGFGYWVLFVIWIL